MSGFQEVHYVRRSSDSSDFTQVVAGPTMLLANKNYAASPWFSDDCSHLYLVAGVDVGMNQLAKYTLQ
ncbi:MAG: hypothetical protein ACM31C_16770 [Acidobacteriota bacterium]